MKQLFNIISLIIMLMLLGCSREQSGAPVSTEEKHVHEVLMKAEQLAGEHPDSALSMIWRFYVDAMERDAYPDNIEWKHISDEGDVALFGLLYTEVIHKKGMSMHQDTLIANSLSYYEQTCEPRRLCKALTHRGISLLDNGRMEQAADVMKRAETIARKLDDDTLGYDVSMALGRLNQAAGCNGLMTQYYKEALATACTMGSNLRRAQSMNSLMRAYLQLNQTDSAWTYVKQAVSLSEQIERAVQAELLASVGTIKLRKGQRDAGRYQLEKALRLFPSSYAALQLGNFHAVEGDTLTACNLWAEALQSMDEEVLIEAYQRLVAYYDHHEQWRALDLSKMLNGLLQKTRRNGMTERVAELQAQYDLHEAQQKWHRRLWTVAAVCGLLLVGCWLLVAERRNKKRQFEEVLSNINDMQERLSAYEQQATEKEEERNKQTEQERNGLNELLDENLVYWFHRKALVGKQPDHEDWNELHLLFERHQPLFVQAIGQYEDLSERDRHVCMLIRLRFQPTEIAALIGASPQTVTNRRTWLLSKLFGEKGGARDFDRRIQELEKKN